MSIATRFESSQKLFGAIIEVSEELMQVQIDVVISQCSHTRRCVQMAKFLR